MKQPTYYITTPIYYPSAKLHIGHSYTTVACDALARYKRMQGFDVLFLTGSDEHGQKIADAAEKAGTTPKEYVDRMIEGEGGVRDLWRLMDISLDRFIRTTDEYHMQSCQAIFQRLYDQGDIYKGVYEGHYCKPCESFWTDSQLIDGNCPDCSRPVHKAQEEAYFFKTKKYADRLLALYEEVPDFIQPESRKNEMISFIKQGLQDTCVSRTSVKWGIPVPFDPAHTMYVWVDALSNYITALGYENDAYHDYDKFWPASIHMVGKEILRFHAILWPAMLMALDLPLPHRVFGHGWLLLEGGKMSKSKGNIVDPSILCERYSTDAIRYFLLREIPFGNDGVFSNEALITRINSDLANDLGNLLSRTVSMIEKYFDGKVCATNVTDSLDEELLRIVQAMPQQVTSCMDQLLLPQALAEIFKAIQRANKYIDETTPWVLAKQEETLPRLQQVLYHLCETLRFCAALLAPFMPSTAPKIAKQLGCSEESLQYAQLQFGNVTSYCVEKGEPLFPRIDLQEELKVLDAVKAKQQPAACPAQQETASIEHLPEIKIDDFMKCELRAAKVLACEIVPESKKLLKLTLFDGEKERTILSGIAKWYAPQDLINKTVAIVANLAPRPMLKGAYVSEGMVMAADLPDESACVLFLPDHVPAGALIH